MRSFDSFIEQRPDFNYILDLIPRDSRVLDLGSGDGELLILLEKHGVKVQGLEKNEESIYKCIERGLIVHHGDLDDGLKHHLTKSFDYVILNQIIQETQYPGGAIKESLRIGKKVVVVFPNFGHWKIRWKILLNGKTPVTKLLPYRWYDTPNLHYLSVIEFYQFCKINKIKIEQTAFFSGKRRVYFRPNLLSCIALFVLTDDE